MILRIILRLLVLPPASTLLTVVASLLIWKRYPRTARSLMAFALISLWLLSTPLVSSFLVRQLELPDAFSLTSQNMEYAAIVILGGGIQKNAPEYGDETVSLTTLSRLRYGAFLYKKVELPILVSGGRIFGEGKRSAELMRDVLQDEFHVPVNWLESNSRNTEENAKFSVEILAKNNITKIVLVTSARHMMRAREEFEKYEIEVHAAPTTFPEHYAEVAWYLALIPRESSLRDSNSAIYEHLGRAVYKLH